MNHLTTWFIALLSCSSLIYAQENVQGYPCDKIGCKYCISDKMFDQCPQFCTRTCGKDDPRNKLEDAIAWAPRNNRPENNVNELLVTAAPRIVVASRPPQRREQVGSILADLLPEDILDKYTTTLAPVATTTTKIQPFAIGDVPADGVTSYLDDNPLLRLLPTELKQQLLPLLPPPGSDLLKTPAPSPLRLPTPSPRNKLSLPKVVIQTVSTPAPSFDQLLQNLFKAPPPPVPVQNQPPPDIFGTIETILAGGDPFKVTTTTTAATTTELNQGGSGSVQSGDEKVDSGSPKDNGVPAWLKPQNAEIQPPGASTAAPETLWGITASTEASLWGIALPNEPQPKPEQDIARAQYPKAQPQVRSLPVAPGSSNWYPQQQFIPVLPQQIPLYQVPAVASMTPDQIAWLQYQQQQAQLQQRALLQAYNPNFSLDPRSSLANNQFNAGFIRAQPPVAQVPLPPTTTEQSCPRAPSYEPCVSKDYANEQFASCCSKLDAGCRPLCSYDNTQTGIQVAVLTGRCPVSQVLNVMKCAAGEADHRACCQAKNVFKDGRDFCSTFCNPNGGIPTSDPKYLACLSQLPSIQHCMWAARN